MKAQMRCKACGFVTDENRIGEVCPACGVPRKMFEPFTDNISEKRRRILESHLHPVIVHAPQTIALFLFLFSIAYLATPAPLKGELFATMKILSLCLPFTLVGAFLSGLLDGKTRFRRTTTPILRKKILLGIVFFFLSAAFLMVILSSGGLHSPVVPVVLIILGFGCLMCSAGLGLMGASLLNARFPG